MKEDKSVQHFSIQENEGSSLSVRWEMLDAFLG